MKQYFLLGINYKEAIPTGEVVKHTENYTSKGVIPTGTMSIKRHPLGIAALQKSSASGISDTYKSCPSANINKYQVRKLISCQQVANGIFNEAPQNFL